VLQNLPLGLLARLHLGQSMASGAPQAAQNLLLAWFSL
jgi:hypothetical protein